MGGSDGSFFSVSDTGVIVFTSAPDYENPTDANTDNGYQVTVNVSDGTNANALTLLVNVEPLPDNDGTGNNADTNDDGDGVLDVNESSVSAIADSASTNEESAVTLNPLANDTIVTAPLSDLAKRLQNAGSMQLPASTAT